VRISKEVKDVFKRNKERFFLEFSKFHRLWLMELVRKYKENGVFPVYPTQIIEYYPKAEDKEIVIFSAFCMCWNNGKELEQITSMRKLIGKHPAEWFANREFVTLSFGREQKKRIDGYMWGYYWKIAKVFDLLYDECYDGRGVRLPSEVFRKASFPKFCEKIASVCEISDIDSKRRFIEMILRTSDGLGRGLWKGVPSKVKCPFTEDMRRYLQAWFPDYKSELWTWDEAVHLFGLEHDYDFFYAYNAHKELERINPKECKQYITRYRSRWDSGLTFTKGCDWKSKERGRQPDINF